MPPVNDTQLTEEQKTKAERDAEAAFSSGFKNVRGEEEKPDEEIKPDDDKPEEKAAAPAAVAKPEAAAPAADPWEGVSPIVREHLEKLGQLPDRLRNVEGHIGGLNSTVKQITTAAKAAATDKGAASPSEAQIAKAIDDDAEFARLTEEYPEWGNAINKQMAVMEKRIMQKVPQVNVDAIRKDILKDSPGSDQVLSQVEEVIPLYVKHPTWKKDIKSPEFHEWGLTGGPSVKDYNEFLNLGKTEPVKAKEMLNDFIRQFPNWWSEKGSKLESSSTDDAIALLDSYNEFKAAKAATPTPAEQSRRSKEKSQQRLSAATTPKGTQQPPQPGVSDEEAFNRGFKKQSRKA